MAGRIRQRSRDRTSAKSAIAQNAPNGAALEFMRPAAETRWADLARCSVTARSPGRRQVPVPACAVTRAGVWIGLAETIDARHARGAVRARGGAAYSPASGGAITRTRSAV